MRSSGAELPVRAAAAVAMALTAVVAVVLDGSYFWALVAIGAIVTMGEWASLFEGKAYRGLVAVAAMGVLVLLAWPGLGLAGLTSWEGLVACTLAILIGTRSPAIAAGIVYIGVAMLALFFLRDQSDGTELTIWTIAVVCATDIGAYFIGRAIGGPKLAPRLSPGKTWAGLLGGMTTALAVGIALGHALHLPLRLGALGAALAVVAQAGDLFESWLKRRAGVKDSGRILPGHGGAFDRLDGLLPVACLVAALVATGWI